jgi:YggT family protein
MTAALELATARTQIADYISTVIYVYTVLILLYIVVQILFAAGLRPPYSRISDAVIAFLRDVCEPYLRIFRRVLPSFGGIDFSPIIAILVLGLVNTILVQGLLHG